MTEAYERPGFDMGRATLISASTIKEENDSGPLGPQITYHQIVLAISGGPQPYVTWRRWLTVSQEHPSVVIADSCSWGHYHTFIDNAVADYKQRVEDNIFDKLATKAIANRARQDGLTAAAFFMDATDISLNELVAGMDSGDPEIIDQLPQPRLSGEFADEPSWEQICKDEIDRYDDDGEQALLDIYHREFHSSVEETIRNTDESMRFQRS